MASNVTWVFEGFLNGLVLRLINHIETDLRTGLSRTASRFPRSQTLRTQTGPNFHSLDNKLISYQRETRDCCVICLTETWMSSMVPDSAIELTGFSVHCSDRTKELTGKSRGGGVCFYINNLWYDERNMHSIKSFCSPDLEFHMLLCRPFWLPREFTYNHSCLHSPTSQHRPGTQGTVQEYKWAGNRAPRCSFYYHGGL